MNLLKKYGTDPVKAAEGARMDLGEDAYFLIRPWRNVQFLRRLEELQLEVAGPDGDLSEEDDKRIIDTLLAETIIAGWEHIDYPEEGDALEYSAEAAFILMQDDRCEDLRLMILQFSQARANYRLDVQEKIAKN